MDGVKIPSHVAKKTRAGK